MNESMFERRQLRRVVLASVFLATACFERAGTREDWSSGAGEAPDSAPSADELRDASSPARALDAGVFVMEPRDMEPRDSTSAHEHASKVDAATSDAAAPLPVDAGQVADPLDHEDEDDHEDDDGAFDD